MQAYLGELAALGAALSWSVAGLISVRPSRVLGPWLYNRARMVYVSLLLVAVCVLTERAGGLGPAGFGGLAASGAVGIALGDTALFASLARVGPRRAAILFATHAPLTVLLAFVFLGERLDARALVGCALVFLGVVWAIGHGGGGGARHPWERVEGPLALGAALGLVGGLCQAAGTVLARPVLEGGADPLWASAIRVSCAGAVLFLLRPLEPRVAGGRPPLRGRLLVEVLCAATLGMAVGVTLLLVALAHGEAGVVATLSSTTPILVLPLTWAWTRERPPLAAWGGAALAVLGTGLLFSR